ncbi:carboxylate--amine ligase [Amycolatopsis sp. K13G38]|uniref:Carboxylate--amine ligase n=2 Tax=Amycolatopsis acididurans TaxID=2724524 RepID=A0ABX1J8Q9_9PSEU|nr:carboxylate--amine ligase [Amycolatopsis acididurans]
MHHGGLGAIRTLGRAGIAVYGVHEHSWAPAAHSRYLRDRWVWPPGVTGTGQRLAALRELAARIGRRAVLVPTDDAAAIFLAEHGDRLREMFAFPSPPPELPRLVAEKHSLTELCRRLDIACPETWLPGSPEELTTFAARVGFPLVAKAIGQWRAPGGLKGTRIVRTPAELDRIAAAAAAAPVELIWQEFVPGGEGSDWFFHGYCDANSRCRPAFTGLKRRSYPAHAGLTSFGVAMPNGRLREAAVALLAKLEYQGIVDLDFRYDAREDQYELLDFNPRLGAQFRLFRDTAGVDVVLAQYLDLTGQRVEEHEQVSGRAFVTENYDPIAALAYWRRGELDLRSWVGSLRTVEETAWFARDDLRPFGLMCLRMGWRAMTRRRTSSGGRTRAEGDDDG